MKLVHQRNRWDCGIAAMATAFEVSYDRIRELIGRDVSVEFEDEAQDMLGMSWGDRIGPTLDEIRRVAFVLGVPVFFAWTRPQLVEIDGAWNNCLDINTWGERVPSLLRDTPQRAILGVPPRSPDHTGLHYIVVQNHRIWDPSAKNAWTWEEWVATGSPFLQAILVGPTPQSIAERMRDRAELLVRREGHDTIANRIQKLALPGSEDW